MAAQKDRIPVKLLEVVVVVWGSAWWVLGMMEKTVGWGVEENGKSEPGFFMEG